MAELEAALKARLKQLKVRIDNPDDDTLLLRNVPTDSRCFSKKQTSVLVKRPRAGLPFLVCVDEDLEYTGPDSKIARTFATAGRDRGWLVVSAGSGVYPQAEDAVRETLAMLGTAGDGRAPRKVAARPAPSGLVPQFAVNITAQVRNSSLPETAPCTIGREEAAEQAATSLLSWQRRLPVLVGAPGVGKSNLLYRIAHHLAEVRPEWELLSLDLGYLLTGVLFEGEREKLLSAVLEEAAHNNMVLALERLELAIMTVPLTPWMLAGALDRGARLAATCLPSFIEKLAQDPLARRIDPLEITDLAREDVCAVLRHFRDELVAHHGVAIEEAVVEAAVERCLSLSGHLPDKAVKLLDTAAARAVLAKQPDVTLFDVYLAASRMKEA